LTWEPVRAIAVYCGYDAYYSDRLLAPPPDFRRWSGYSRKVQLVCHAVRSEPRGVTVTL
jgi:hypothetical protein